jgi:DNA-directed RNA polymerase I subunit RPA43
MLVHRTFNVSIPRHHIPTEEYEFEHGPAENDPEFGVGATEEGDTTEDHSESGGRWVHKITREPLGGKTGRIEFTVIGYVVSYWVV